ncbi:MAG: apolipoprotein N-acyltransferase, partial [Alphaproteobacteria bacterium]|nr:apolipoprotein N-acyltransferase [Alphaproteobacteria bacterium]
MMNRLGAWFTKHPKWTCFLGGSVASLAMAPTFYWPLLIVGMWAVLYSMAGLERPKRGAWCTFAFGMGFFIFGLYWIANALLIKIEDYWWVMGLSIFGLPLLLSICWFIAGWVCVKLTKPHTLARSFLFMALLGLAEYGRAYNLTGFPWNLFGYSWGFSLPMMQFASIGGAYGLTALTIFWAALPFLLWQARGYKKVQAVFAIVGGLSLISCFAYGYARLSSHPTEYRDDVGVAVIQPNITQDEKWEPEKALEHFLRHVDLMKQANVEFDAMTPAPKTVAYVWPETSIDESLFLGVPDAPRSLLNAMTGHAYTPTVISGFWREQGRNAKNRPNYYNSVAGIVISDNKLKLDTMYDKHHLVPFGEFLPMEQLLDLTPVAGFAGFQWGPGPRVQQSSVVPPYGVMICFEAIFPWYAKGEGDEWIVNTSNDGWYGDTPGPYQHLTMTRFRAAEQGKPIARAATTGISALIDPYGRVVGKKPYQEQGFIVSKLPKPTDDPTI